MGVRHSYVKKICKDIMEQYPEMVSTDFEENKQFLNRCAQLHSKGMRNRIAGCLVVYKKNEGRVIIPPYTGKPKKRKGWKKKEKIRNRRRNNR